MHVRIWQAFNHVLEGYGIQHRLFRVETAGHGETAYRFKNNVLLRRRREISGYSGFDLLAATL